MFLRRKTFAQRKKYAWDTFSRGNLSKQTACTQRNSYTEKLSQTETFTHGKLLHTFFFSTQHAFTQRRLCTQQAFMHRIFLHKDIFNTNIFTHRKFLRIDSFYTKSFCTHRQIFLHTTNSYTKRFYTQHTFAHRKLLRREAFTHRDFTHRNCNILHRDALIQMCVCNVMYVM